MVVFRLQLEETQVTCVDLIIRTICAVAEMTREDEVTHFVRLNGVKERETSDQTLGNSNA